MKEGLNKMEKANSTIKGKGAAASSSSSHKKIGKLGSETMEASLQELSYAEEIALYLKCHLHFPDEGLMKIALTLSSQGSVEGFKILSSSSLILPVSLRV